MDVVGLVEMAAAAVVVVVVAGIAAVKDDTNVLRSGPNNLRRRRIEMRSKYKHQNIVSDILDGTAEKRNLDKLESVFKRLPAKYNNDDNCGV